MKVKNIIAELKEKIENMSDKQEFENKKIYIWGISKASYISAQYLLKKGYNVLAIIDNDSKHWGKIPEYLKNYAEKYKDLKVNSPEILKENDSSILILVYSRAYDAILKQALTYGINEEKCIHMYSPEYYLTVDDFSELREISIEERKNIQYEILKYLKDVCERNNIRYYLAAGTLLGAVRHKGYIPWDDDIDVYMPWDDYKYLIELFKNGKEENDRYSLKYYGLVDNFSWLYVKIQDDRTISRGIRFPLVCDIGVNIDVFPMCGLPVEVNKFIEFEQIVSDFHNKWARHMLNFSEKNDTTAIEKDIESIMSMYKFDDSMFVGYFFEWEKNSYSAYKKSIKMLFEDDYFDAPAGYDEVLTNAYGNYMQPPPNWQIIQYPHTYKAFWKEKNNRRE